MNDNNFSSLDRLVEFGLGMGMAQQMINMMNQTMQNMQIPSTAIPVHQKYVDWYIVFEEKPSGPFSEKEIKKMLMEGLITKESLVWCTGMSDWQKAECTPSILKLFLQLPPSL